MPIDELFGEPNGLAFFNANYIDPILHVAVGVDDIGSIAFHRRQLLRRTDLMRAGWGNGRD